MNSVVQKQGHPAYFNIYQMSAVVAVVFQGGHSLRHVNIL
jgi:hypothetical protein